MAQRLEAQDRQRRNLMADIAHELRTPLTVVQGKLEGLLDGVYARDDAHINEVLDETRILARLMDDLRTLANAESGMLALNKEPTDLAMLIQDVINTFAPEAQERRISIRFNRPSDGPPLSIDPLRIREVLSNLLSNALRHTGEGKDVTISLSMKEHEALISVADTGSGIGPEELPKIFDRFYKGEASRGSGLGLTIARNFVTAHGGSIRAESELGRGTTIVFTLPRGE
jgi:two-component system OmpR family sensor kinase/two-component system sensor histidine kinase BaeS